MIGKTNGGGDAAAGDIDLRDFLIVETKDGRKLEFEVVGLVEDDEHQSYAVAYSEAEDEFVVTDARGTLLENTALAQEILDDFRRSSEESDSEDEVS